MIASPRDLTGLDVEREWQRVEEAALLDVLRATVDSEATWKAILVDNPARLHGF